METKVLRREYSNGEWRTKSFGGIIAVGNGEDQKSYHGSMIVDRELQQQLKPRGRSITAGTLVASSGREFIKSRDMAMNTPRVGGGADVGGDGSVHSVIRRMVEACPGSPVVSQEKEVKRI